MKKKIVGYTTGVFDLFHIGHLNVIKRAKKECDYLILGVTTDELVMKRKGKLPIIPFSERVEILKNISLVDKVVSQHSMNKIDVWKKQHFDVVFVGDDWKGTESWIEYERQFVEVGVSIVYFPYTQSTSSSQIRKIISSYN